uniref:SSD domain-containing protein n=1 Tax=Syphacia muris TaxID=451379 RepID=A0A158R6A4_9BILA
MRPLERCFFAYGQFLARYPLPFLLIPVILTLISTLGIKNFHSQDDIWDIYSPTNGKCRVEEKALEPFEYASSSHHYRIQILANRKDGGNLFNEQDISELMALHNFVVDNITVLNDDKLYTYNDFCGTYCNSSNLIVLAFLQAVIDNDGHSSSIQLTYPNAQALQKSLFVGYSLGNLHFSADDPTEVDEFRLFVYYFMVDLNVKNGREIAENFEKQLKIVFEAATKESTDLEFALLSRDRELEEQRKITLVSLPFLGVTAGVLVLFMILTLINFPLYKSQHVEAIFGVVSPSMALITSGGFLWAVGFPFSNILTVVPFLVITIGIDDAFLILAGWRHSNVMDSLEKRIGTTLAKSGASVTVTSVTDVLCFAVGLISNLPVVQLFCLYTSIALTVDFIYQVTFFTAVVVYCGKRQIRKDEKRRFVSKNMQPEDNDGVVQRVFMKLRGFGMAVSRDKGKVSTASEKPISADNFCPPDFGCSRRHRSTLLKFVDFLHHKATRWVVVLIFVAHIAASAYLCTLVNTDFEMENLYLKDSPLNPVSRKMQKFVLNESFVVNFVIYPVPNFQDTLVRDMFNDMVHELETIPKYTRGEIATNLWIREFADIAAFWGEDDDIWEPKKMLSYFREYGLDENSIITKKDADGDEIIAGFTWSTAYYNMQNFLEVQDLVEKRRTLIAKYSGFFNVSSHHPLEKVPTESAASAPSNFLQTAASAVILMSALVFLFVLDFGAIIAVVLSILSICIGTVGYLHLWNVRLDAVSLISMLMSIGFSVDYSAHICYHFFTQNKAKEQSDKLSRSSSRGISIIVGNDALSKGSSAHSSDCGKKDTRSKLEDTFKGVGWPVIQSGVSTAIGMIPLILVRAYVVAVFWKTVLLVTMLGLFHALFLLPVIFLIFSDLTYFIKLTFR